MCRSCEPLSVLKVLCVHYLLGGARQVSHPHRDSERASDLPQITQLVFELWLAASTTLTIPFYHNTFNMGLDPPASLHLSHHDSSQTIITSPQSAFRTLYNLVLACISSLT